MNAHPHTSLVHQELKNEIMQAYWHGANNNNKINTNILFLAPKCHPSLCCFRLTWTLVKILILGPSSKPTDSPSLQLTPKRVQYTSSPGDSNTQAGLGTNCTPLERTCKCPILQTSHGNKIVLVLRWDWIRLCLSTSSQTHIR